MKLLFLDIETSPNVAHVWGLWKQNISINQLQNSSYVMCWGAKWAHEKDVMFDSRFHSGHKTMLKRIHKLLEKADAVVHYNGSNFDIPTLNKEFLLHGFTPPATYQQIDLLKTARKKFRFPSNKLDYLAQALEVGGKIKHEGHELWVKCMAGDPEAWDRMQQYNVNDVLLLEKVYERLLPWVTNHPNAILYSDVSDDQCPHCGSVEITRRGFAYTATSRFQRFHCRSCGTWFRSSKSDYRVELTKDKNG